MSYNHAFQDDFYTSCTNEEESKLMVLKDKHALCEDLKYILSVPDLCDVTFLVGQEQYPVHGLRAILASRSRIFYLMILAKEKEIKIQDSQKKIGFMKKLKQIRKLLISKPSHKTLKSLPTKLTISVEEYEVSVFERLLRYIHCGVVSVDVFTVVGLLNAAENFELECLKNACWEFAVSCIRPDLVHDLIASANEYSTSKLTNQLLKEIQEISFNQPELLYYTPRSRSCSTLDLTDNRRNSKTTNGFLMRTVL
ncbi:serine-enriched protein-like [Mytilus californianus]|uniref:serine-enriched protein-like n=1 Tax=Mytilus californianus TaxID=6549 RepID=UPI00224722AC|nr:serine-enriched protein-like [Mytilus californianus]